MFSDDEKVEQLNIRNNSTNNNKCSIHQSTPNKHKVYYSSLNEEAKKRYDEKQQREKKLIDYDQKIKDIKREKLLFQIAMDKFRVFEPQVKSGKCFAFSPSPKESYFTSLVNSRHVPGPCYYNHNNILESTKQKKSFHINNNDIWL